jgi:hypothetical protein
MSRPTIEDAKAVQRLIRKPDCHIVWFDEQGFEMAHTDAERAQVCDSWQLTDCDLHIRLCEGDRMPVPHPGWYMWMPSWMPSWKEFFFLGITPPLPWLHLTSAVHNR